MNINWTETVGIPTFNDMTCIQVETSCSARLCLKCTKYVCSCVTVYYALSVACQAHSCILYAVIMKGIGWSLKVFCVHGCIHQIQIYPDQYVNKIH